MEGVLIQIFRYFICYCIFKSCVSWLLWNLRKHYRYNIVFTAAPYPTLYIQCAYVAASLSLSLSLLYTLIHTFSHTHAHSSRYIHVRAKAQAHIHRIWIDLFWWFVNNAFEPLCVKCIRIGMFAFLACLRARSWARAWLWSVCACAWVREHVCVCARSRAPSHLCVRACVCVCVCGGGGGWVCVTECIYAKGLIVEKCVRQFKCVLPRVCVPAL